MLGAVPILALEQPLAPSEPPTRGGGLPEEHEVVADPPRAACRAPRIARVAVCVICPLQRAPVLVVQPEHVRRARDQLEVIRRQLLLSARATERIEGDLPVAIRAGSPTLLENAIDVHESIFEHRNGNSRRLAN